MSYLDILGRAARAVLAGTDLEASFYEGQDAVESWAVRALELALNGDDEGAAAQALLDRYESAPWDHSECEIQVNEDEDTITVDHEPDDPLHRLYWKDVHDD